MNADPRRKFSVTLKPHTAQMLARAVAVFECLPLGEAMAAEPTRHYDTKFIINQAILAVSRAIVQNGGIPLPLACELRKETQEEMFARIRANDQHAPEPSALVDVPGLPIWNHRFDTGGLGNSTAWGAV